MLLCGGCMFEGTTLFLRHDVWQRQTPITPNKILRTVSILLAFFFRVILHYLIKLV